MTHKEMYNKVPVGGSTCRRWAAQDSAVLNAAAEKIAAHGGNPWVFVADARHYHQFAGAEDRAALLAMLPAERAALLGEWESEEWNAFSFGPGRQVDAAEAAGIAAVAAIGR